MFNVTPSVRAAFVGIAATTLVVLAASLAYFMSGNGRQAEAAMEGMVGKARVLASAFESAPDDVVAVQAAFDALSSRDKLNTFVYTDADGRVLAATDRDQAELLERQFLARGTSSTEASVGRQASPALLIVSQPVGTGTFRVAVASPAALTGMAGSDLGSALAVILASWGLLVGLLVGIAWYTGPHTANMLTKLSERIARDDADVSALIRHAEGALGPLAGAFAPVGRKMRALGKLHTESRDHVAALYQINPNYVLLCTLEGQVVEGNPAFYAITGLSPDAVRGADIGVLDDVFDVAPFRELAQRSLLEGSAIFGIGHVLMSRDDEPRPVEVALRAFRFGENEVMLIQATDVAVRRKLERRVNAFSDTLDLMVDQRVAQLTAGQQSLRKLLDDAGLVVASFDAAGGTRRWSGGARALTARPASQVSSFQDVVSVLGLDDSARDEFARWFWSPTPGAIVQEHVFESTDGSLRTTRVVWHAVVGTEVGLSDARTLVGLEVPMDDPRAYPPHAGDGLASETAEPA